MHTDDASDHFPLGKRSAVYWDSRIAPTEMPIARQRGSGRLVFLAWEALQLFTNELAGDLKAYGAVK